MLSFGWGRGKISELGPGHLQRTAAANVCCCVGKADFVAGTWVRLLMTDRPAASNVDLRQRRRVLRIKMLRADGALDVHAIKEDTMTSAQYSLLMASLFALGAMLQIVRVVTGLPITVGRTSIPIWVSWVACGVAIILAWLGYAASRG